MYVRGYLQGSENGRVVTIVNIGHWRTGPLQTRPITDLAYNKLGPSQTRTMIIYILK
jgi:hypothetical protein